MSGGTTTVTRETQLADMVIVPLNKRLLRANDGGFIELARLNAALAGHAHRRIVIDAHRVHHFDPALAAPLMIVLRQAQLNNNAISFARMGPLLRQQLELHRLLVPRPVAAKRAGARPSRPPLVYFGLREFLPTESEDFANYSKRALDRAEMPIMTPSLKERFFEGIDEVFENSSMHSGSRVKNASCGVYNFASNTLKFVFSDGGMGMRGAFERRYQKPIPADDAIAWAMAPGNTTRSDTTTGGLGLKIVREFIHLNGGKISIASREGYWAEQNGRHVKMRMPVPFPGTIVSIEINTLDDKMYDLKKPDPNNIW